MPVTTDENQLDGHAPAEDPSRPAPGAGGESPAGHRRGRGAATQAGGWRVVVVTAEVWALALVTAMGRGLRRSTLSVLAASRRMARAALRHWPAVRAELEATPGELASLGAAAAVEALADVAGLARALRDGMAWTAWSALWAARRSAAFVRRHWPGLRRRLLSWTHAAVVSVLAVAHVLGRAAWVALVWALSLARAGAGSGVRAAPGVLAALARLPVALRGLLSGTGAERPWPVEHVRPSTTAEPIATIGPHRLVARLMAIAAAAAIVSVVVVVGAAAATRTAVATVAGSAHMRKGRVILPPLAERSIVYAADGSVLAVLHVDDNRQPVTLGQVAPVLVDAVVDTEDALLVCPRSRAQDVKKVVEALGENGQTGYL